MGKKKKPSVAAAIENNTDVFLKHGPGLRYDYQTFVVARDPERKQVLIGGLGCMGVGQMWFPERPGDEDRPGYADAPTRACNDNFDFNLQSETMVLKLKWLTD